jgi:hypothetical protein
LKTPSGYVQQSALVSNRRRKHRAAACAEVSASMPGCANERYGTTDGPGAGSSDRLAVRTIRSQFAAWLREHGEVEIITRESILPASAGSGFK